MAEHYFTETPSAPSRPMTVELRLPDMEMRLAADRGVFSGNRVDPGTMTLLRESPVPPAQGELLDLGCGYGPIVCALARRAPAATVWATDINSRALQLTAANAVSLDLNNIRAVRPDHVPTGLRFNGILVQPPRARREGCPSRAAFDLAGPAGRHGQRVAGGQPPPGLRLAG